MKKCIICEFIIYLVLPLVIWNFLRNEIGNYYAMLLSTIPGIIYTIYSFLKDKRYSITGIYMLASLFIGRGLDLVAGSAEVMLWNDIYIKIFYCILWLTTVVIKKPLMMYFAIDYACLMGYERESSKKLYMNKEIFKHFQYLTVINATMDLEYIAVKAWTIMTYGVDGFSSISIIMKLNGYVMGGIILIYIIFLSKKIEKVARCLYNNNFKESIAKNC